jgi:hypothetical protein
MWGEHMAGHFLEDCAGGQTDGHAAAMMAAPKECPGELC